MSNFKGHTALVAAVLSLFCLAGPAAAEQIKESYHPMVNGSPITLLKDNMLTQALGGRMVNLDVWAGEFMKYDDNIYNTRHHQESDTIWTSAAGFKMDIDQKDVWNISMVGQLQYNEYVNHTDVSGWEGFFNAKANAEFSPALSARVELGYEAERDEGDRDEEDVYTLNRFNGGIGTTLKPSPYAGIDIDYSYYGQRADVTEREYRDYDEHSVTLRPFYDITPYITLYLKASGSYIDPKKDICNSGETFSGMLGAAWKYKDEARLFAEVGAKYMHFDDEGTIEDDDDSVTRPIFRVGGDLALSPEWKTGFEVSSMPLYASVATSSRTSNYLDRIRGNLFVSYSPGAGRFTFTVDPYYALTEPSANTSYADYGVHAGISYVVTEFFNVSAGYRYSVRKYSDESSYDRNIVTVGCALTF